MSATPKPWYIVDCSQLRGGTIQRVTKVLSGQMLDVYGNEAGTFLAYVAQDIDRDMLNEFGWVSPTRTWRSRVQLYLT